MLRYPRGGISVVFFFLTIVIAKLGVVIYISQALCEKKKPDLRKRVSKRETFCRSVAVSLNVSAVY